EQMCINLKAERAKALYTEDANAAIRKSHENPDIQLLYKEFLGEPGSHKAHELLHTHYHARPKF
ncbi:MAG: iron hydrogenase small subunit, partial [Clostridia bacterium]|nr:iron hydrogenase small subunit [Clostridia bacterium]